MSNGKPKDISSYKKWLKDKLGIDISNREKNSYEAVAESIKTDFEKSDFWTTLTGNFQEYNDEYLLQTGFPLMRVMTKPELVIKPFDSLVLKTYRKNILDNKIWPKEPDRGWVLPANWYTEINDIVRTLIEVKYFDGVEFMIGKVKSYSQFSNTTCNAFLEAREEGYYAAHIYIKQNFEIPTSNWDTDRVDVSIELQITTQLQEVMRKLLHDYYEDRRQKPKTGADTKWQWDYKSNEFSANYLGHILHYVEGMIVEIRNKQKERIP